MARTWLPTVVAVTVRPHLWATALRQGARMSPDGWWRRPPFVPRPSRAYLRFRSRTAYGDDRPPQPRDVVEWLEWCRGLRR